MKVGGLAEPVARAAIHRRAVGEVVEHAQDVIDVRLRARRRALRQTDVGEVLLLVLADAFVVRCTGALVIVGAVVVAVAPLARCLLVVDTGSRTVAGVRIVARRVGVNATRRTGRFERTGRRAAVTLLGVAATQPSECPPVVGGQAVVGSVPGAGSFT